MAFKIERMLATWSFRPGLTDRLARARSVGLASLVSRRETKRNKVCKTCVTNARIKTHKLL